MVRPKKLGEVNSLNTKKREFFSSKYSLKAKAGNGEKLQIGQEIYCIPLTANGIYEVECHKVSAKGDRDGFKSWYNCYIPCRGVDPSTGEVIPNATCCMLAKEENDKATEIKNNGGVYTPLISYKTSRVYLPVLLLGNDVRSKAVGPVPITKLNMTNRDYCFLEFSGGSFRTLIDQFTNDLLNNGRIPYELEGEARADEILAQLQKHIMKISISAPEGKGGAKHKKIFSFISFSNQNIGAETGAYRQITEGLAKAPKLQAEANEFLTLFETELDNSVLVDWTDAELTNYVHGANATNSAAKEAELRATGTAPQTQHTTVPKAEQQIVIEDDGESILNNTSIEDDDDDMFDGSDIALEEPTPVIAQTSSIQLEDDDVSFEMEDDEDFFGE